MLSEADLRHRVGDEVNEGQLVAVGGLIPESPRLPESGRGPLLWEQTR